MAQNMYRVGDYVYFEVSSSAPYQVRKIEELNKTPTGNVEAKVLCYYRRRDVPPTLLKIADQAERKSQPYCDLIENREKFEAERVQRQKEQEEKERKAAEEAEGSSVNGTTAAGENGEPGEKMDTSSPVKAEAASEEKGVNGTASEDYDYKKDLKDGLRDWGLAGLPLGAEKLPEEKRHMLRQRELFLSRTVETLPATNIRGKCTVTLLSECENVESYDREDAFFYSLVFDPVQMTLLADKGTIRVSEKHQAVVPEGLEEEEEEDQQRENGDLVIDEEADEKKKSKYPVVTTPRETLVYHPHHPLVDREIDQFLIIARAVGTFSRALDTSSSNKLPSLHMTAAAASRDVTLLHAMALLHQADYDIGQATKFLVPPPSKEHYPLATDKATAHNTVSLGGPILCRDQMEEWSAAEANLFEEGIEKLGKDFNDIRQEMLPWKSLRDIVEYYYMYKTTNRYTEMKKQKTAEKESKLKQVYIPNYNKPNSNLVGPPNPMNTPVKGVCQGCESTEATSWYAWGPADEQLRLCGDCWTIWKKNGGLKKKHKFECYDLDSIAAAAAAIANSETPSAAAKGATTGKTAPQPRVLPTRPPGSQAPQVVARLPENHPHSVAMLKAHQQLLKDFSAAATAGTKPANPTGRCSARASICMLAPLSTKLARKLAPKELLSMRRAARRPFDEIKAALVKAHCANRPIPELVKAAQQLAKSERVTPTAVQAMVMQALTSLKRPLSNGAGGGPPVKRAGGPSPLSADSRWLSTSERLVFVAGPKLKMLRRRQFSSRRQLRRLSLRPCTPHSFVDEHLKTALKLLPPTFARCLLPVSLPSSSIESSSSLIRCNK